MVAGYEDPLEANVSAFRDGWFYPGDLGVMVSDTILSLRGRNDDLVNLGGLKVDCAALEEKLKSMVSAEDFCVTAVSKSDGTEQLCIAFVFDVGVTLQGMKEQVAPYLSASMGEIMMMKLDKIPRSEAGKVQRDLLHDLIENEIPASESPIHAPSSPI